MLAAVYEGVGEIAVREVPRPKAGEGEVVVAVGACGICGSDLHAYEHGRYLSPGQIMGHEIAGVVTDVGPAVAHIEAGDRVGVMPYLSCGKCSACRRGLTHLCRQITSNSIAYGLPGGFAEFVRVPRAEDNLYRLRDHVGFGPAALAEPFGVGLHAARMAATHAPDEPVLVIGAGAIGLLTVAALRSFGEAPIVAVDLLDNRLAVAGRLGAEFTVNPGRTPLKEVLGEAQLRPSTVIECSGGATMIDEALRLLTPGGLMIATALYAGATAIDPSLVVRRELRLRGSFASTRADFKDALDLLTDSHRYADALISHRFALAQAAAAFVQQADRGTAIKVMIHNDVDDPQDGVR